MSTDRIIDGEQTEAAKLREELARARGENQSNARTLWRYRATLLVFAGMHLLIGWERSEARDQRDNALADLRVMNDVHGTIIKVIREQETELQAFKPFSFFVAGDQIRCDYDKARSCERNGVEVRLYTRAVKP